MILLSNLNSCKDGEVLSLLLCDPVLMDIEVTQNSSACIFGNNFVLVLNAAGRVLARCSRCSFYCTGDNKTVHKQAIKLLQLRVVALTNSTIIIFNETARRPMLVRV